MKDGNIFLFRGRVSIEIQTILDELSQFKEYATCVWNLEEHVMPFKVFVWLKYQSVGDEDKI